ncbi:MAG: DUF4251 domain-containing protein [Tannerella sp.]|jgi:hypothetical protein|nr:DUF4251 domain-containing protein [Tannerella sp.]
MKRIHLFLTGAIIGLMAAGQMSCSSSKTAARNERAETVKQQLESRRYTIDVDRMLPMQGPSQHLTTNYGLTIKGDTVISYLPYFGRAYSVPYGGGKGLNFEALISDYSLVFDAKGVAKISFRTRSEDDLYLYEAEVFNNGKTTLRVTSNNRQGISFYGQLKEEVQLAEQES